MLDYRNNAINQGINIYDVNKNLQELYNKIQKRLDEPEYSVIWKKFYNNIDLNWSGDLKSMLLPIKNEFEQIIENMMLNNGNNINDGCIYQNKNCICGNTGLAGICNYGPHKSGFYCRCD